MCIILVIERVSTPDDTHTVHTIPTQYTQAIPTEYTRSQTRLFNISMLYLLSCVLFAYSLYLGKQSLHFQTVYNDLG